MLSFVLLRVILPPSRLALPVRCVPIVFHTSAMDGANGADQRPQDCPTRMALGLGSGFVAGNFFGAVASNWGDVPRVLRDKPLPALARTGSVMMQYGTTLGLVGLAFSTVDCIAESIRGKKDWVNGALGGAAAGAILGVRIGRVPVGVGAAAALAFGSALVDASGGKLVGGRQIADGATPPRRIYPYET